MAKIKTTIGEVHGLLEKAIEYHRIKMTHGSIQTKTSSGFFSCSYENSPMEKGDYWVLMMTFSPWNQIQGFYNAALTFPPDREMWISMELAAKLGIGARNV